jgi:hypothetical protein
MKKTERELMQESLSMSLDAMIEEIELYFRDGVNWTPLPQRIFAAVLKAMIQGLGEDTAIFICRRRDLKPGENPHQVLLVKAKAMVDYEKVGLLAEMVALSQMTDPLDPPAGAFAPSLTTIGASISVRPERYLEALKQGKTIKKRWHRPHPTFENDGRIQSRKWGD